MILPTSQTLPEFLTRLDPTIFLGDNYVVLDFEVDSSHGDFGNPVHPDNQLLLACYTVGADHRDYRTSRSGCIWGGEFAHGALLKAIASADFIVAHNAKYELGWLKRMGVDLRKVLPFDTQLAEYVLLGNLASGSPELGVPRRKIGLDMCARRRGLPIKDAVVDTLMKHGINPVRMPRNWLQGRCDQDVATTESIFLDQRSDLVRRSLLGVAYTRMLLVPVLADIESEGMALDPAAVEETYAEYQSKLVTLEKQFAEFTGGINWRSPKQSGVFIYETLGFRELTDKRGRPKRNPATPANPDGGRKTDQKTLALLEARTERQRQFLSLRKEIGKVSSALSKALEFYIGVVREKGGTFYAQLNQTNTATHRLSSTGIALTFEMFGGSEKSAQFQNQPRIFKRLFRAKRRGWLMADPDGSSLEFRVATQLGGPDIAALRDIESGWDVHLFTASMLHNVTIPEVEAEGIRAESERRDSWRQLAKPDTFKPLYGGTKGSPEQERYYAAFRLRYPGIAKAQQAWVDEALLTKQLRTPWGLIFHWPTARMSSSGYVNVTSAVYNYPIQSLATAEIIPIAVVYLWHRIGAEGLDDRIRIVNLVHDNAPSEVHPSAKEDYVRLAKQAFTHDVYHYLHTVYGMEFSVPLGIGIRLGEFWGKGEERQFNIWRDGREQRVK